ncbi:hypothetical protein D3C86_1483860 [compost metagenome]
MTGHELLGKILAAFQYGTFFFRADYRDIGKIFIGNKKIVDPVYQRLFRAHNHQADIFFKDQCFYSFKVVGVDVYVFAVSICAAITRSDKQL